MSSLTDSSASGTSRSKGRSIYAEDAQRSRAGKANFKVVLRIRPTSEHEIEEEQSVCTTRVSDTVVCVERPPERQRGPVAGGTTERSGDRTHTFTYDRVFHQDEGQEAVFDVAARDVVLSTLEGYNGTVIAYGQTGTGKTHTMEGTQKPAQRGIIPRACETIFGHIDQAREEHGTDTFLVRVSFFQIYNERITDLLAPGAPDGMGRGGARNSGPGAAVTSLSIRQDGAGETYVDGLSEHIVKSPRDVQALLRIGQRARNTAATLLNQASSRSHAVFSMVVERSVPTEDSPEPTVTIGKLNMVDLAGSERVKNLNASTVTPADRLGEAKMINSSLSAFGKVILALTSRSETAHVPYRDSKLTRILQNSLGGNCKTALVTTVSPASGCYLETIASLKFAYLAKDVENHAMVNQDMSQQALLTSYQREVKRLRAALENQKTSGRGLATSGAIVELKRQHNELARENERKQTELEARERETEQYKEEKAALTQRLRKMEQQLLGGERHPEQQKLDLAVDVSEDLDETVVSILRSIEVSSSNDLKGAIVQAREQLLAVHREKEAQIEEDKRRIAALERRASMPAPTTGGLFRPPPRPSELNSAGSQRPSLVASTPSLTPRPAPPERGRFLPSQTSPESNSREKSLASVAMMLRGAGADDGESDADEEEVIEEPLDSVLEELRDPETGIPTRTVEFSGGETVSDVFSGLDALTWFIDNIDGLEDERDAQKLGQHLVNAGDLIRADSQLEFVASEDVFYHLNDTPSGYPDSLPSEAGNTDYELPPLHDCVALGDLRGLKEELEDADLNEQDTKHRTPLIVAAIYNQPSCATLLLRAGADASLQDVDGRTALLWAAYAGHARIVRMIIRASQSTVGMPDKDGRTPLHWSTKHVARGCVNALATVSPPATLNRQDKSGVTPMHWAVLYDRPKHVARLLRAGATASITDHEGRTPLHYAVADERTACLQALLKVPGTDVNHRDGAGRAPLHLASNNDGVSCLTVLVKQNGININVTDSKGTSPLHWAAVCNNVEACCVLAQYGANLKSTDDDGMTAEDHARAQGFDHCVQALQDLYENPMAHIEHVVASPKHPSNRLNAWQSAIAKVKAQNSARQPNRRSSTCIIS